MTMTDDQFRTWLSTSGYSTRKEQVGPLVTGDPLFDALALEAWEAEQAKHRKVAGRG